MWGSGSCSELDNASETLAENALFPSSCTSLSLGEVGIAQMLSPCLTWLRACDWPPARLMKWEKNSSSLINLHEHECVSCLHSISDWFLKIKLKKNLSDTWTPASPHFLSPKADSLVKQIFIYEKQNKGVELLGNSSQLPKIILIITECCGRDL